MTEKATISLSSGPEWGRVLRVLRIQDKTIPRKIKKSIRERTKPTIVKVKAAILKLPTEGRQHTGLRKRVARGVTLKINRGVSSVRIVTTVRNSDEAAIPRGLDTPKGWRHPVFGDREDWVQQPGHDEFFRETIAKDQDSFREGLEEVLQDARSQITEAGLAKAASVKRRVRPK